MPDIPSLSSDEWQVCAERARTEKVPIIVRGVFSNSIAVQSWSPASLADRFGEDRIGAAIDLPGDHAPYLDSHSSHGAVMTFRQLIERMEKGERCYLNQFAIDRMGNLRSEIDVAAIACPPIMAVNLWIGGATRSGLHFDSSDNFLIQVFGVKRAVLIAPQYGGSLHVLSDNPSKSSLSPAEIEAETHSPLVNVPRWRATIEPGDALFIPRGWWHYLASIAMSISVNVWHGDSLSVRSHWAAFVRSGPAIWARTVRDFVWCGMLHRPYHQRLFSPPPLGVSLYEHLQRARRPAAPRTP